MSKGTTWTRVYKNIDVDAMSLANEVAQILQSAGFSASIKEKGLIRKSVTVNFKKKGGLFSFVRGELRFSGDSKKFMVEMSFIGARPGSLKDILREIWQSMDTLVQKHGVKTKGLPIEIEGKMPQAQQPAPPQAQQQTQPVQQVSVVVPIVTPQQPQQQPQQPVQVTVTRCPHCGATITQPGAKFCPNCGASLQ